MTLYRQAVLPGKTILSYMQQGGKPGVRWGTKIKYNNNNNNNDNI